MGMIRVGDNEIQLTDRKYKGFSIIDFPEKYCVVDIETTGLSPKWDEIIEIAAVLYSNGEKIDEFQSLVKPKKNSKGTYVDDFISELTGITNDMLDDAPTIESVIEEFAVFLNDTIIVGYNVSFDVNFLYDSYMNHLNKPLENDFVDVMRIARRLRPKMPHHRLCDMVKELDVSILGAHRALYDCLATNDCFNALKNEIITEYSDLNAFINSFERRRSNSSGSSFNSIRARDVVPNPTKLDEDSPLYNKHCVITGTLEKFSRKQAMQIIADLGGINEDTVTKKTNYLILGNFDYCNTVKDGKSTKQKRAEAYKLSGQDIMILPESVFYDML